MVSIPLPTFDAPFSSPLGTKLTADVDSTTESATMTILPGVKVDGVAGGTAIIGGISNTVKVKKGKASFEGSVNVFKQSYTFKNGKELSLSASVDVELPFLYTIKLTGSDKKKDILKICDSSSDLLPKTKSTLAGTVTLREDPLFKNAGILVPPFTEFKKWTQKITVFIAVTFEASKTGDKRKTASVTRTLVWALRPLFQKDDDNKDPPKLPKPYPSSDSDSDWKGVTIPALGLIAAILGGLQNAIKLIRSIPKRLITGVLEYISSAMAKIPELIYGILRAVSNFQEAVSELLSETETVSQGVESAEVEMEATETEIETIEAEVTTAEEALAVAEAAETTAAAEVVAATAAEVAADASEAADWWTIIGAIASAAAIAAASIALVDAVKKHNHAIEAKKQAQTTVNSKKIALSQKQLTKKQAKVKVQHQKDILAVKQMQLKDAKEKEQDAQDAKDALKAAHDGIQMIAKLIKEGE